MFQNAPNPFNKQTNKQTNIRYALSINSKNAIINIYNMNGTQLKSYKLINDAEGVIEISNNELDAGMYLYSLIIDGQLIDTKRMVLTD